MWIKQQLDRTIVTVAYPVVGLVIANLDDLNKWMTFMSLFIGIVGGLVGIASMIHHWNNKNNSDQ